MCTGTALKDLINTYVGYDAKSSRAQDAIGYDNLDLFINSLLLTSMLPRETKDREPEIVYYQQTPARIILALIEKANFTEQDISMIELLAWVTFPSWPICSVAPKPGGEKLSQRIVIMRARVRQNSTYQGSNSYK